MLLSSASDVDNANAGVFFSTATLLIGVLVTVIGAAFTQVLLDGAGAADVDLRPQRRRNLIVLAVVILVDLWGVGFPLYGLYRSALGSVTRILVTQVFISTIAVGAASIVFPVYAVNTLYSVRYWFDLVRIGLLRGDKRTEAFREMLIKGGYIEAERYDSLMLQVRSDTMGYESTVELLGAFNKCLILGRQRGISSLFRTLSYYYFQLIIPLYARSIVRKEKNIASGSSSYEGREPPIAAGDPDNTSEAMDEAN